MSTPLQYRGSLLYLPDTICREAGALKKQSETTFEGIMELLRILRSPDGCPWDRSKRAADMKPYLLEECHELLEAIDGEDSRAILSELGDLLLHCAFLAMLGEENGDFSVEDVFSALAEKIRRRHPTLFQEGTDDEGWELLKARERQKEGVSGILEGIPMTLPPLLRAFRLQERAAAWKFDWPAPDGALEKVSEEMGEIVDAYRAGERVELEQEIGDLFFAVVNFSRMVGFHPDEALSKTIRKFARRFDQMTDRASKKGLVMGQAGLEELDKIWDEIKNEENQRRIDR